MIINANWLMPTTFIDSDSDAVAEYADTAVGTAEESVEVARRLFYAIRDDIRYDPYALDTDPVSYRASVIAGCKRTWCIPKSVLFVACARYKGIPARLGFADVRNHLTSEKLSTSMGTDLFAWHGYAELLLNGRWVKLSTAFNIELCDKFGTKPLEFDGVNDALMHPFDQGGRRHMEYVNQRGSFDDLPLEAIFATFLEVYPNWARDENGKYYRSTAAAPENKADSTFN